MAWFNLGRALDKEGLSMTQFAEKLGIKVQVVSRYFKPGFDPNASSLLKWTVVLNCSLDDLLDKSLSAEIKQMPRPKTAAKYDRPTEASRKKPKNRV